MEYVPDMQGTTAGSSTLRSPGLSNRGARTIFQGIKYPPTIVDNIPYLPLPFFLVVFFAHSCNSLRAFDIHCLYSATVRACCRHFFGLGLACCSFSDHIDLHLLSVYDIQPPSLACTLSGRQHAHKRGSCGANNIIV